MIAAHLQLNIFDAIVFGTIFLCALLSMFRGFVREVLSLVAWVGAAVITLYSVERVSKALMPSLKSEMAAYVVGTLATYFGSLIVISIINAFLLRYIKPGKEVGAIDNILGLLFGILKGMLIVALGFFILTQIYKEDQYPDYVKTAWSRRYVEEGTKLFAHLMPGYLGRLSSIIDQKAPGAAAEDGKALDKADPNAVHAGDKTMDALKKLLDRDPHTSDNTGGAKVIRP